MRNVLVIGWYDIKRVLLERESLFWIFAGPLVFTVFFGLIMRPAAPQVSRLTIVNQDSSDEVSQGIISRIEREGITTSLQQSIPPEKLTLLVPSGTAAAIRAGGKVELTVYASAEETNRERDIRFKIQKALTEIYFDIHSGRKSSDPASESGPLAIKVADLGVQRRQMTSGFQRSVPAYLVMFVFLNLLVSGAGIAEDRASGRLRRMAMAPVTRYEIVLGKLLGRFAIGWVQIAYMLSIGWVARIRWADHPWVLFIFLSLFALASASLGILFGTLFKDPDKCANIAVWSAIVLSPLGGLWWPLEIVGPFMRQLAYFVPTGWAMEGINAMLAFGAGAVEVAPYAAGFLLIFALSFPLAAKRLQV